MLYGITVYFNPCNYKTRLNNYKKFREYSKKQSLKLLTVELTFGDQEPTLSTVNDDAEIVIHVRGKKKKGIMWQKERLLNIALEKLPEQCTKVCWLDCDLMFQHDDWVQKTSDELDRFDIVQPYSIALLLPKDWEQQAQSGNNKITSESVKASYAFFKTYKTLRYSNPHKYLELMTNFPVARGFNSINVYDDIYYKTFGRELHQQIEHFTTSGFAWAATRKFLNDVGGFYDKCVVGGGDTVIKHGLEYSRLPDGVAQQYSPKHLEDLDVYIEKLHNISLQKIGCVDGAIMHMYHGSIDNRRYVSRYKILREYDFDPATDIKLGNSGVYEWNYKNDRKKVKKLAKAVRKYFKNRKEDT